MEEDGHGRRRLFFIPHDLMLKILIFLPARSLTKFRSVCKSWLSSIADRAFITSHADRTVTTPLLLFINKTWSDLYFYDYQSGTNKTLPSNKFNPFIYTIPNGLPFGDHIHRSVNGMLLLYSWDRVLVLNPFTREIITLPPPPESQRRNFCATSIGFGVDPSSGKYKLVSLNSHGFSHCRCDIFTQGSRGWRAAASQAPLVLLLNDDPISMKGVLYWIVLASSDQPHGSILSLDLAEGRNDKFTLFPLPPLPISWCRNLEVLQGRLCIVDCSRVKAVDIWMLKEPDIGGGGTYEWSKWYTIDIHHILTDIVRVIAILENKFLIATEKELFSYEPENGRLLKLLTASTDQEGNKVLDGVIYWRGALYTETLAVVG